MSTTKRCRSSSIAAILALATSAQVLLLLAGRWPWPSVVVALLLGAIVGRAWTQRRSAAAQMLLVTGALGGLAMLVGSIIDIERAAARPTSTVETQVDETNPAPRLPPCHEAAAAVAVDDPGETSGTLAEPVAEPWPTRLLDELCSWMVLCMLSVCVPACVLLCEPCQAGRGRAGLFLTHLVCTGTMLVGMIAGGVVLGPLLSPSFARLGLELLETAHVSMLLGMVLGTALGAAVLGMFAPHTTSTQASLRPITTERTN